MKFLKNLNREDFLKILPENSVGAEIGVLNGDFSKKILNIIKPRKLYLIDSWWLNEKEWREGHNFLSETKGNAVDSYLRIVKDFSSFIDNGKVVMEVGDDVEILARFPNNYFDWVYLDTSHTYVQTSMELEILKFKVHENGFITGHDWFPNFKQRHHGVYLAVKEFIEKNDYRMVFLDNHFQWCIRKKK